MSTPKICIIGCGWLGLPLGAQMARSGWTVKGSTTRTPKMSQLAIEGIIPFHAVASPSLESEQLERLLDCDIAIVTVPPSSREGIGDWPLLVHQGIARALVNHGVREVILLSSTSVYPQENGVMKEADAARVPSLHSGVVMLDLEKVFVHHTEFRTTVLRLAGLVGGERHPAKFLRGSGVMKRPEAPVNLVHRDDVIGVITHLIQNELFGNTYNVTAPEHPSRRDFYNAASQDYGLKAPEWEEGNGAHRIIDGSALKSAMNYGFKYPDPLSWWKAWETVPA